MTQRDQPNRRRHARLALRPMYTSVKARPRRSRRVLEGHVYDISQSGARIELDQPLKVGATISVTLKLPAMSGAIHAVGRIVWQHDEQDDPGPRRMALCFTEFKTRADRSRLLGLLSEVELRIAA